MCGPSRWLKQRPSEKWSTSMKFDVMTSYGVISMHATFDVKVHDNSGLIYDTLLDF